MGAKFSKGGKVKQNGTDATHDESLDTFNKTSTLPASFRKKDDDVTKAGTLPRGGVDLDRNKSFSKRFRKSITKLVGHNEVKEEASESQESAEPITNGLSQEECKEAVKDVVEEEVDSKVETTPAKELDIKTAQKRARAKFFQDLYNSKEPAHIPKPPRSRNIPSPTEPDADITVPTTLGTPVVKLIKKHEGAIEKQQELIGTNISINFPEKENKGAESPESTESMNKDDGVCQSESEKQMEEIKQEEVSAVKGETNIREDEILSTLAEKNLPDFETNIEEVSKEEISLETAATGDTVIIDEVSRSVTDTNIGGREENLQSKTNSVQAEDGEELVTQETIVAEETISKEETLMTQNIALAASHEKEYKEESTVDKNEDEISNLQSNDETSLSPEIEASDAKVENTKEQIGAALVENMVENQMAINDNKSDDKEPQATLNIESRVESNEAGDENCVEKVMEGEPLKNHNEEPVMTKDNGDIIVHDEENKGISSQEEKESLIDQSSSCNAQQDNIIDDNFTEPNSLESINQTDEINQSVTEEKQVENTVTGESDLVKETVTADNDIRSEGGSEEGVSTDEGIVASDDEENKLEIQKVTTHEASENKSLEKCGDDAGAGKEL